jgi:hypothetical protein
MKQRISRRQFIIYSIEGAVATSFLAPPLFRNRLMPRIGIVGLGHRGRAVLSACAHDSVQVTALCDVDPSAIRAGSALYPSSALFSDFKQLTSSVEVDAVAIATPRSSTLAEDALRRGKHVFLASPDCPDEDAVNRILSLASEHSREVGLVPHDPSWDIGALNRLLGLPLASVEGVRTRLTMFSSNHVRPPWISDFGLDLLHHAVQCPPDCVPSAVRAVSSRASRYACWSAKFLLNGGSSVDLHAQELPELNPGEVAVVMETSDHRKSTRVVLNSTLEPNTWENRTDFLIPELTRFLGAISGQLPANDLTGASCRVLRWSRLLRNVLPA